MGITITKCIFVIAITSPVELRKICLRRSKPYMRFSGSTFLLRLSPAQAGLFFGSLPNSQLIRSVGLPPKPGELHSVRSEAEGMDTLRARAC